VYARPIAAFLSPGVGPTRSVRCEPPYSRTMGRHIVIVFFPLYEPHIGCHNVTDAWGNGDYDEDRSMRFPSGL
jgi:hypothetical protein